MSNTGLFIMGTIVTVPVAAGLFGLLRAALLDGRENERVQREVHDRAEREG
jgi:hypothetical protein